MNSHTLSATLTTFKRKMKRLKQSQYMCHSSNQGALRGFVKWHLQSSQKYRMKIN